MTPTGSWGVVEDELHGTFYVRFDSGLSAWLSAEIVDLVVPRCPEGHGIVSDCESCQRVHSERRRAARIRHHSVTVPAELLADLLAAVGPGLAARVKRALGIGTIVGLERVHRERNVD